MKDWFFFNAPLKVTVLASFATLLLTLVACSAPTPTLPPPAPTPTLVPATSTAIPTQLPPTQSARQLVPRLDDFFNKFRKSVPFDGVVLIARDGAVLYEKSFGETRATPAAPITLVTKFRIASASKQFTAAAILKLQQEGKLNAQERLCKHLEPCPANWNEITIHQLLTHTSGIPGEYFAPGVSDFYEKYHSPQELVARFGEMPLDFKPGEKFSYGNGGYIALAALIEQLSGDSYEAFLRKSFFEPLEMKDTGTTIDDAQLAAGPLTADLSNFVGGGNIYSTAQDLYRWAQQLDAWQRDEKSAYQPMFQMQTTTDFKDENYGYGLWQSQVAGHARIGHGGLLRDDKRAGYGALVERYPDSGLTIVFLTNRDYPPDELGPVLAKLVLNAP